MKKADVKELIITSKKAKGLGWEEIASKIGMSPVWTTSVCLGMNSAPKEKADMLEIDRKFLSRSLNEGFSGGEKKRN